MVEYDSEVNRITRVAAVEDGSDFPLGIGCTGKAVADLRGIWDGILELCKEAEVR